MGYCIEIPVFEWDANIPQSKRVLGMKVRSTLCAKLGALPDGGHPLQEQKRREFNCLCCSVSFDYVIGPWDEYS